MGSVRTQSQVSLDRHDLRTWAAGEGFDLDLANLIVRASHEDNPVVTHRHNRRLRHDQGTLRLADRDINVSPLADLQLGGGQWKGNLDGHFLGGRISLRADSIDAPGNLLLGPPTQGDGRCLAGPDIAGKALVKVRLHQDQAGICNPDHSLTGDNRIASTLGTVRDNPAHISKDLRLGKIELLQPDRSLRRCNFRVRGLHPRAGRRDLGMRRSYFRLRRSHRALCRPLAFLVLIGFFLADGSRREEARPA
jgi:hypothetical protein